MNNVATAQKPSNGTAPVPPRANRMTLAAITSGVVPAPYRLLIHGKDGCGKTTFGAGAPKPVFLGTEDGTGHIDVARFPVPETWDDVLDAVKTLTEDRGGFETLVVDSLDWAEPLLWAHVCRTANVKEIESVGGGFGKGYVAAVDGWRIFLAALERLQEKQRMHVILIAHSLIKKFANPEGEDYERYVLALHDKSAGILRQWAHAVYWSTFETFAGPKKKGERSKGVSTGARLLYTQPSAAYDAKDRYCVPETLPLNWDEFDAAVKAAAPADPKALASEIERKAKQLGGELEAKTMAALGRAGGNAAKLAQLNDWVSAKIGINNERSE